MISETLEKFFLKSVILDMRNVEYTNDYFMYLLGGIPSWLIHNVAQKGIG